MSPNVLVAAGVLLALAALVASYRVVRGPRLLDRMVAVDVLTSTLLGLLGLHAIATASLTYLPIMIVLAMIGFLSSVAVARYVTRRRDRR